MLRPALIEFPADDPERARRFWSGVLGSPIEAREPAQGSGWQTAGAAGATGATGAAGATGATGATGAAGATGGGISVGVHERGRGPGDTAALPYFDVEDLEAALAAVVELGGSVVHPGERWAICRDSEGSPFGLALERLA